jgi:hypothetical protein
MTEMGWVVVTSAFVACFIYLLGALVRIDQCHQPREQRSR